MKLVNPRCQVFGVEPSGNDVILRSVRSGKPERARDVNTIADSLSPPFALPFSLGVVRRYVDDIVLVSDDQIVEALFLLFDRGKLAVEPAAAAALAGLLGPLAVRLAGKRVGLMVCGTNIDGARFADYISRGAARWSDRSIKDRTG
jgi:threonine dehydratase